MKFRWLLRVFLTRTKIWKYLELLRLGLHLLLKKPHENDFQLFSKIGNAEGLFLDVGANIGQSAVSFRIFNKSYRVFSLEPNQELEGSLKIVKKIIGPKFNFKMLGAGELSKTFEIFIPVVDGVPFTQEGSFDRTSFESDPLFKIRTKAVTGKEIFALIRSEISLVPIDDLGLEPNIVKIDVQGHELAALKGMQKTLTKCRPLLMIENVTNIDELRSFLATQGYTNTYLYSLETRLLVRNDNNKGAENVFFLPAERIKEFESRNWI